MVHLFFVSLVYLASFIFLFSWRQNFAVHLHIYVISVPLPIRYVSPFFSHVHMTPSSCGEEVEVYQLKRVCLLWVLH
jgi:hypothetical protein